MLFSPAFGGDGKVLFVSEEPVVCPTSFKVLEYSFITPIKDVGTFISPFPASSEKSHTYFDADESPLVTFSLEVPYSLLKRVVKLSVEVVRD